MTTVRIYDRNQNRLALDLRDLMRILAPCSLSATWSVSTVKADQPYREWFEATGEGGERLETLAEDGAHLSGVELAYLADETGQVIWGEFVGVLASKPEERWIIIRAIDSSFYEVTTTDDAVLSKIKSNFNDVRPAGASNE